MTIDDLDDFNDLETTAKYLKLPETVLLSMARRQVIGSLKQGRTRTFPREAIAAYAKAHTTEALPSNPFGLTNTSARRLRAS